MANSRLLAALLFFFCLLAMPTLAQKQLVVPGKAAGSVELGTEFGRYRSVLGNPAKVESSPSDPSTKLYRFGDLCLLVGQQDKVIGITVLSNNYRTAEGFGVGSTESEIQQRFGPGLSRGTGNRTYPSRGIGFSFDNSARVSQLYVFKTEGERPLLGDRIIRAGSRAGELRLGMRLSAVEQAWGAATSTVPMNQGRMLVTYQSYSVRFVVQSGVIDAILLTTGDFITPEGLKVGSTTVEVQKALGQSRSKNKSGLFYPKQGIGFIVESNQVTEIQILSPK